LGGHSGGVSKIFEGEIPQLRHLDHKQVCEKRTKGLMRDLCRCKLGKEAIGALSFSWGSAQVENDAGAKFEVGLRELPN
jgi:hypothetical protein